MGEIELEGRPRQGFVHQALLHAGPDELLAGVVPFVEEGLDAGETVLVAVLASVIEPLRTKLSGAGDQIQFLDMAEVGRNPARIIPLWQDFLDGHAHRDNGVRGVGQPVWSGRSAPELAECHIHEALLNVAFEGGRSWSLLCPYDVGSLTEEDVAEAHRTHPHVADVGGGLVASAFGPRLDLFAGALPEPPAGAIRLDFTTSHLRELRSLVGTEVAGDGLTPTVGHDLVLAISELATNSILHGGGRGELRIWREDGTLVFDVRDAGPGGAAFDPLVGRLRPEPGQLGGMGLWIANQTCDLVQVRTGANGTTVRARIRLP